MRIDLQAIATGLSYMESQISSVKNRSAHHSQREERVHQVVNSILSKINQQPQMTESEIKEKLTNLFEEPQRLALRDMFSAVIQNNNTSAAQFSTFLIGARELGAPVSQTIAQVLVREIKSPKDEGKALRTNPELFKKAFDDIRESLGEEFENSVVAELAKFSDALQTLTLIRQVQRASNKNEKKSPEVKLPFFELISQGTKNPYNTAELNEIKEALVDNYEQFSKALDAKRADKKFFKKLIEKRNAEAIYLIVSNLSKHRELTKLKRQEIKALMQSDDFKEIVQTNKDQKLLEELKRLRG